MEVVTSCATERRAADSFEIVVQALPRSIAVARHAVARLMDPSWGIPVDVTEDVLLMVSELVTNAVLHARTAVQIAASVEPGRITVAVGDDDPFHAPRPGEPGATATSGRGMRLVDLLATAWGVHLGDRSKVVWFEVAFEPAAIDLRAGAS